MDLNPIERMTCPACDQPEAFETEKITIDHRDGHQATCLRCGTQVFTETAAGLLTLMAQICGCNVKIILHHNTPEHLKTSNPERTPS